MSPGLSRNFIDCNDNVTVEFFVINFNILASIVTAIALELSLHCEEITSQNLCRCSRAIYTHVVGPHWKWKIKAKFADISPSFPAGCRFLWLWTKAEAQPGSPQTSKNSTASVKIYAIHYRYIRGNQWNYCFHQISFIILSISKNKIDVDIEILI